jgi:hypothetical protein
MTLYIGLVHYPVYNKHHERIASAITTLDLHDLSRLGRTYGVKRVFVINPLEDQQRLAERVLRHWTLGYGATYNEDRKEAIELIGIVSAVGDAREKINDVEGKVPIVIATDAARQPGRSLGYADAKRLIRDNGPVFILFGTAWGLDREIIEEADYVLDPVEGIEDYNHLSVRAAAAIILDRLAGRQQ